MLINTYHGGISIYEPIQQSNDMELIDNEHVFVNISSKKHCL